MATRAAPRRGLGPAAPAARSPPARGPVLRAAGGGTAPAVWGSVSGGDHGMAESWSQCSAARVTNSSGERRGRAGDAAGSIDGLAGCISFSVSDASPPGALLTLAELPPSSPARPSRCLQMASDVPTSTPFKLRPSGPSPDPDGPLTGPPCSRTLPACPDHRSHGPGEGRP